MTPAGIFLLGILVLLVVTILAAWWLDRIERRRSRPIAEHSEDYWE